MSRKINLAIEIVFDLIKLRFIPYEITPTDFDESRFIRGDKTDTEWLKDCSFKEVIEISPEFFFGIIEFAGTNYFVTTGYENPVKTPTGLVQIQLNAGLFTAIVSDIELPVRSNITTLMLEQNILSQSTKDPLYEGHEYLDLASYFPNIVVNEITAQYAGDKDNLYQIICAYLSVNKKFISIQFSQTTLNKINEIALINSNILNYESIVQALLSSNFKFSFLDLYRCIELLYQIIYIDDAYMQLGLVIQKNDFLNVIENKLSWRPQERGSLNKIFAETPESYKHTLVKAVKVIRKDKENISDWVYDLRCSIVHLKSSHKRFDIKQGEWDKLIEGLADIIIYWYTKYPTFI